MLKRILLGVSMLPAFHLSAQDTISAKPKERLDFARTYFEAGAVGAPSFSGKRIGDNQVISFKQPAAINQYLTWGAFHFWGRAEFYVTFPLDQLNLKKNEDTDFRLDHSVVTGARYYPWAVKQKKIAPYLGISWAAMDFRQIIKPDENQPTLSKDFLLKYEAGLLYSHRNFGLRLGVHYYSDARWDYPLSKTVKSVIKTPPVNLSLGLLYAFDLSRDNKKETIDRWNDYPTTSKLSYKAERSGAFFVGIGPSMSFSLADSEYNRKELPYLKKRLVSNNCLDAALGYHFHKANLFTAFSFRNPKFVTEGYGDRQTIRKHSLAFEVNRFLTDYTGFAPFVGLNVAYEKIKYSQLADGRQKSVDYSSRLEPGFTLGWDIVPGKTEEALILRTNLRWYPFSKFRIEGQKFDFSQLEYNLIQVVFYPERLKKKR